MVLSNTSPLNYLVIIERIDVLPQLYGRVVIPPSVYEELQAAETPQAVRAWVLNPPDWLEISSETGSLDSHLVSLHAGERDAISLALLLNADALIIDERPGRNEAERRGIKVIGTIGVLIAAHERGLLHLGESIGSLRQTTFHISPELLAAVMLRSETLQE